MSTVISILLMNCIDGVHSEVYLPVASFTKEVSSRLAKRPLVFNGRLANHGLTSLVKEATGDFFTLTQI